jgi:hypothetical protein
MANATSRYIPSISLERVEGDDRRDPRAQPLLADCEADVEAMAGLVSLAGLPGRGVAGRLAAAAVGR